ncbi:MAG: hypothetical protein PWP24_2027 [Clostridiales bacterium]|nr:hypothetical protein [Clostridiales bacterium]
MVSKRNYVTITLIMLVILFMFQSSGVIKENWNDYKQNPYANEESNIKSSESIQSREQLNASLQRDYVIYLGDEMDKNIGNTVLTWCTYTKRRLVTTQHLDQVVIDPQHLPEALLVDAAYLELERDVPLLEEMISQGINVIFCDLPKVSEIQQNEALKKILGIESIYLDQVTLQGIRLYSGFLLGGEQVYDESDTKEKNASGTSNQDLTLVMPWYVLTGGTKSYLTGILNQQQYSNYKNEFLPAIIWRNSIGSNRVFAVNGDYMTTLTGVGILDAMMAECRDYEIYPIINSQNLVILNNPVVSKENDNVVLSHYSRSSTAVYRDIIWPGLVALAIKMQSKITCMITPQLDYLDANEPDEKLLDYFFRLISEQKGEVGLSLSQISDISFEDKVTLDNRFLTDLFPDYAFASLYLDQTPDTTANLFGKWPLLSKVQTIVGDYMDKEPLFHYVNQTILQMNATIDGFSHTYSQDLRVKSIETALGYSTITADMKRVIYPSGEQDEWQKVFDDFGRYTTTYWKPFSKFEQTTLSQADKRIRDFLALDYTDSMNEDIISLKIKGLSEDSYFILRTHSQEVSEIVGGTSQELETDAYLIHATNDFVTIHLASSDALYYYNK